MTGQTRRAFIRLMALLFQPLPLPLPQLPRWPAPKLPAPRSVCDETFVCGDHETCDLVESSRQLVCHRFRIVHFCSKSFPEIECDQQTVDLGPDNCCG